MSYDDSLRDWASLSNLVDAPHWVYAIHEVSTERCVYVGMTSNLRRRLGDHGRLRGWSEPAFRVTSTEVSGRAEAERTEIAWMRSLRPTANRYPVSIASAS